MSHFSACAYSVWPKSKSRDILFKFYRKRIGLSPNRLYSALFKMSQSGDESNDNGNENVARTPNTDPWLGQRHITIPDNETLLPYYKLGKCFSTEVLTDKPTFKRYRLKLHVPYGIKVRDLEKTRTSASDLGEENLLDRYVLKSVDNYLTWLIDNRSGLFRPDSITMIIEINEKAGVGSSWYIGHINAYVSENLCFVDASWIFFLFGMTLIHICRTYHTIKDLFSLGDNNKNVDKFDSFFVKIDNFATIYTPIHGINDLIDLRKDLFHYYFDVLQNVINNPHNEYLENFKNDNLISIHPFVELCKPNVGTHVKDADLLFSIPFSRFMCTRSRDNVTDAKTRGMYEKSGDEWLDYIFVNTRRDPGIEDVPIADSGFMVKLQIHERKKKIIRIMSTINTDDDENDDAPSHLSNLLSFQIVGCQSSTVLMPREIRDLYTRLNKKLRDKWYFPKGLPNLNCMIDCVNTLLESTDLQNLFMSLAWSKNYVQSYISLDNLEELLIYIDFTLPLLTCTPCNPNQIVGVTKQPLKIITMKKIGNKKTPSSDLTNRGALLIYDSNTHVHCVAYKNTYKELEGKVLCSICIHWMAEKTYRKHVITCIRCPHCNYITSINSRHIIACDSNFATRRTRSTKHVSPLGIEKVYTDSKKIWFADFEARPDWNTEGIHTVYGACIKEINNPLSIFIGQRSLEKLVQYLRQKHVYGYLYFHNGSGYDFHLILHELLRQGVITKDTMILMRGTRILSVIIKENPRLELRDMYLFLPSSLKRLCKDFKVPDEIAKSDFDHSLIQSALDVALHYPLIEKYIRNDVLSLEFIFKKFSKGLWDIVNLSMGPSISLAAHAMKMWKTLEDPKVISEIYLPHNLEEYDIFRQMYYGGRVLPTLRAYDSVFKVFEKNREDYDENGYYTMNNEDYLKAIPDTLKMVDIVSLYPSQMLYQEYPIGKAKRFRISSNVMEKFEFAAFNTSDKSLIYRSCYKIDVTAPPILVGFLFDRVTVKDRSSQNLYKKENTWYCGVDLYEAVRLGYKITKIHEVIRWPRRAYIFKNFITKLFEVKEANKADKSSAGYLSAKSSMNSVSGKFGQRIVEEVTFITPLLPDNPEQEWSRYNNINIETFFHNEEIIGHCMNAKKQTTDIALSQPTYLSVFILSYARLLMSEILDSVNGYNDTSNTLLYTDTDSLIIRKSTFEKIPSKFIGKKLGQLEDEYPNDYIIAARFLAPKTYTLEILKKQDNGQFLKFYKTRMKGIPHDGNLIEARSLKIYPNISLVREAKAKDYINLKSRFYIIHSKELPFEEDPNAKIVSHLTIREFDAVAFRKKQVTCLFGSIKRSGISSERLFSLKTIWIERRLMIENWWNKADCSRLTISNERPYEITSCVGFKE